MNFFDLPMTVEPPKIKHTDGIIARMRMDSVPVIWPSQVIVYGDILNIGDPFEEKINAIHERLSRVAIEHLRSAERCLIWRRCVNGQI